jgi:hypothetical protein
MKKKVLCQVRQDVPLLDEQRAKAKAKSKKAKAAANSRWNADGHANAHSDASFDHVPHDAH